MSRSDHKNKKDKTEKTWDGAKDSREHKEAGKYPNYHAFKTRSGHNIIYDDSKGNESLTIQHRGGSAIQFLPNGAVQMTAHNGKYNIVFGENRMTVTGANDITVKGDGSMRVYGNYRKTVHGDVEIVATGSITHRGKNINQLASENHSIVAEEITHKAGTAYQASAPHTAVVASDSGAFVAGKQAFLGAPKTQVAGTQELIVGSEKGKVFAHSKGDWDQKTEGAHKHEVSGSFDQKVEGGAKISAASMDMKFQGAKNVDASQIWLNSGKSRQAQGSQSINHTSNKVSSYQGQKETKSDFA